MWLVVFLCAQVAAAQTDAVRPSFEAASVKPAELGGRGLGPLRGGPGTNAPGQLSGVASLKTLLMRAYRLKDYQIAGPAWMDSERYEIVAKIPQGASGPQVSVMLQELLAERFGVMAHRETKQLPLYALTIAKGGPKFKASSQDAAEVEAGTLVSPKMTMGADGLPEMAGGQTIPRSYEVVIGGSDGLVYKRWARRETMEQLADYLSARLGRPVLDATGLKDTYDFTLAWATDNGGAGVPRTGPPPDEIDMHSGPILTDPGMAIFAALPAQLGLKLEARRGPVEILVVDKADRVPKGN
jgi:uncharacterized protein (TIGR03435 family)